MDDEITISIVVDADDVVDPELFAEFLGELLDALAETV